VDFSENIGLQERGMLDRRDQKKHTETHSLQCPCWWLLGQLVLVIWLCRCNSGMAFLFPLWLRIGLGMNLWEGRRAPT